MASGLIVARPQLHAQSQSPHPPEHRSPRVAIDGSYSPLESQIVPPALCSTEPISPAPAPAAESPDSPHRWPPDIGSRQDSAEPQPTAPALAPSSHVPPDTAPAPRSAPLTP